MKHSLLAVLLSLPICCPAFAQRDAAPTDGLPAPTATVRVASLPALQKAIEAASPGERIELADGVYTMTGAIGIAKQGTESQPIVIAAQTIGSAEINGAGGFNLEALRPTW